MNPSAMNAFRIAGWLLLLIAAATGAEPVSPEPDWKDPQAVQREVERIQKKYPGDPVRAAREVQQLTERMAAALGVLPELQARRERQRVLREKYGQPSASGAILGSGNEPERFIDFSGWRWTIEHQADRHILRAHLDPERYKKVNVPRIRVILRTRGATWEEEQDLQASEGRRAATHLDLAYEKTGDSTFRVEYTLPAAELGRWAMEISAQLEPDWEVRSVIGPEADEGGEFPSRLVEPAELRWKREKAAFLERMKQVKEGWSEKQVFALIGEPDAKDRGQWRYTWIEDPKWGGDYEVYAFTMRDGAVAAIEHHDGHVNRAPAQKAR